MIYKIFAIETPGKEVRNIWRSPRDYPMEITVEELEDRIIERDGNKVKVKCALCRGSGKSRWWPWSVCRACLGKGYFWIEEPIKVCNFCHGTGIQPYTKNRLHCIACGGKGVVKAVAEPSIEYPVCHGSGFAPGDRLSCDRCKGQGIISKVSVKTKKVKLIEKRRVRDRKPVSSSEKKKEVEEG